MAQVLVRGLDPEVVSALKRQAERHGRSLQAELRSILEAEARLASADFWEKARELRERFGPQRSDSTDLIREDRDR